MHKKVLSQIDLHFGQVEMPKGFEINRESLGADILSSTIYNREFPFSRSWDMLQTYLREHINLEYGFTLVHKKTIGNIYKPRQHSNSLLQVDPVDLRHSPDYVMLYGVDVGKDSSNSSYPPISFSTKEMPRANAFTSPFCILCFNCCHIISK